MESAIINRLRAIANDDFRGSVTDYDVESPDFAKAEWLITWEWYVDPRMRDIWQYLSAESRWVACIGAIEAWRRQNEMAH